MKRGGPLKRSGIQRKSPLVPKAPMKRAAGLARRAVKAKRATFKLNRPLMDRKLRDAIYARSRGRCDLCNQPVREDSWECHHRKLRSQGGQDSHANLICLHHHCHEEVHHGASHGPEWSYRNGFLVPSWADPDAWPVFRHGRRWQQPTDRGWVGAEPTEYQLNEGAA